MEMCCYVEALSSILSSSVPSGALGGSQLKRQKFQSLNIGLGFPEELRNVTKKSSVSKPISHVPVLQVMYYLKQA